MKVFEVSPFSDRSYNDFHEILEHLFVNISTRWYPQDDSVYSRCPISPGFRADIYCSWGLSPTYYWGGTTASSDSEGVIRSELGVSVFPKDLP